MNAKLLLLMVDGSSMKKLLILVVATLVVIVALPIGAVLALSNLPLFGVDAALSSLDSSGTVFNDPVTPGDKYDYGYCTYWAALRRIQTNDPIPNDWGDAITWDTNAVFANYVVDHNPTVGSIFQWPDAPGGLGHVAYVEKVDPVSGAWTISEMNAVGWDVVDQQTFPAKDDSKYNFIHDKKEVTPNDPTNPVLNLTTPALTVGGVSL
jgi:surface antigen